MCYRLNIDSNTSQNWVSVPDVDVWRRRRYGAEQRERGVLVAAVAVLQASGTRYAAAGRVVDTADWGVAWGQVGQYDGSAWPGTSDKRTALTVWRPDWRKVEPQCSAVSLFLFRFIASTPLQRVVSFCTDKLFDSYIPKN